MGKVIRLTESDLTRIVKRVINEQTPYQITRGRSVKIPYKYFNVREMIGDNASPDDIKNLYNELYNDNQMEGHFDNMSPIVNFDKNKNFFEHENGEKHGIDAILSIISTTLFLNDEEEDLTESDLARIIKRVIKESCEDGNCIPGFSDNPKGRWKDEERDARDSYLEYKRRGGYMDSELFNELYDEMSGKAYFSFDELGYWSSEDGERQNKNQSNIVKGFPTVNTISSWEEWTKSDWFKTSHLPFSKTATKEPISIKIGGGDAKWGEEPIQRKKMYFNQYLNKFGPLLVKKR